MINAAVPVVTREAIERCLSTEDGKIMLAWILQQTKYQVPVDKTEFEVQQFGLKIAGMLGVFGHDSDGAWPLKAVRYGIAESEKIR